MKKYIAYFSLLFVAFATMPSASFGLDGKNDFAAFRQRQMNQINAFKAQQEADMEEQQKKGCPIAVNNAADDMWSKGTTSVSNDKYKQSVKDDTASLQQYKTKYNNVINGSETNKLSNVKCPSNQCEVDCNGLTAICKKGALLKDCNKNVYSCFQNSFVKNEYRMYMVKKVCPDIPEREKFIESFNFDVSKLFKETDELSDADKAAIKAERDFQNSGLVAQVDKNTTETGSVGPAYADADNFDFAAASAAETNRKNSTVIKPNSPPKVVESEEVKNTTPTNSRARASANGKPSGTRSANAKTGTDEETIKAEIKKVQTCNRSWGSPTAKPGSECSVNYNLIDNEKVAPEINKLIDTCRDRQGDKKGISDNITKFRVDPFHVGTSMVYKCLVETCKGDLVPDTTKTKCVDKTSYTSQKPFIQDGMIKQQFIVYKTLSGDTKTKNETEFTEWKKACDSFVGKDHVKKVKYSQHINETDDMNWYYCVATACDSDDFIPSGEWPVCSEKPKDNEQTTEQSSASKTTEPPTPTNDLEKEMAADIDQLTQVFNEIVKQLTEDCVKSGGKIVNGECVNQNNNNEQAKN